LSCPDRKHCKKKTVVVGSTVKCKKPHEIKKINRMSLKKENRK